MKVRTRGLLFDMDGVLISSLGSVERSWQTWAERHGLDVRETIKTAHGMRAIETVRTLKPDADHMAELKVIEDLEVGDNEGLEVLEGVTSILQSVPQKFWTIVTSATERLARSRLAFAGIPVPQHIVTADVVTHGKPHPEPYLKGAKILGLEPAARICDRGFDFWREGWPRRWMQGSGNHVFSHDQTTCGGRLDFLSGWPR